MTATIGGTPILERPVRVRIHITDGQRLALITVLDNTPDERVHVARHTVLFDMDDPRGWLEARTAEWPRGAFPRASLHGVLRKLSQAIQGQVEPDPTAADVAEPVSQGQPDLTRSILRRAADHLRVRRTVDLPAAKAIVAAVEDLVPVEMRQGLAMRAVRAVDAHLDLDTAQGALAVFAWWDRDTARADVIDALEATAAALDGEGAGS